jgi:hypothetical protein
MKGSQQRRSASHTGGFSHGGTGSVSSVADAIVTRARKRRTFIVEVWVYSYRKSAVFGRLDICCGGGRGTYAPKSDFSDFRDSRVLKLSTN